MSAYSKACLAICQVSLSKPDTIGRAVEPVWLALLVLPVGADLAPALVVLIDLSLAVVVIVLLRAGRFCRQPVVVIDNGGASQASEKQSNGDQQESQVPDSVQEDGHHVTTLLPTSTDG